MKQQLPLPSGFLSLLWTFFFEGRKRAPAARLPEVMPDLAAFLEPSESMKFIWLGHSSVLLNLDGRTVLIDPVFHHASPFPFLVRRFQAPVLKLRDLPRIDVVLISHDHYDHLDKHVITYLKDQGCVFITPTGVGSHLRRWGVPEHKIIERGWGESVLYQGITFKAAPAMHFSGRSLFDRNKTLWASWILQGKTEKIYFSGDSGYGPHFSQIGEAEGPFDYAFIENGQYNVRWPQVHMQPEESLQALFDLNASVFIPIHWGMYDLSLHHWSEPIVRTHKIATSWDIPILTPKLGEIVDPTTHTNERWWEEVLGTKETYETSPAAYASHLLESVSPR